MDLMTEQQGFRGQEWDLDSHRSTAPPLLIASILRPEGTTGLHTHVRELQEFLNDRRIPSRVLTPFSSAPLLSRPVFAVRVPLKRVSGSASVVWYRHFHEQFLQLALCKQLRSMDEAVVYAQGPVEAQAALRARQRPQQRIVMAVHFQTSQADEWERKKEIPLNGAVYRSIRQFERGLVPQLDGIVYVSHAARRDFLSWLPEAGLVPSAVIHNFVKPVPSCWHRDLGDLVTIGGLEIAKNHRFLLQVLDEARRMGRPLTLDIYGDGPCKKQLSRQASSLNLTDQVRFRGFQADVREFLPGYRVYVHASYAETGPLAIIEAMAAGLPIVTTNVGAAPELCRDGIEGRTWSLRDPRQAARLLLDFISDQKKLSAAGAASLKRYRDHFHAEVVGPRLFNFLTHPAGAGERGEAASEPHPAPCHGFPT